MLPQRSVHSRYLRSARAAHLARLVAAGAIVVVPAACGGSDDAEVFGASTTEAGDVTTTPVDTSTPSTKPGHDGCVHGRTSDDDTGDDTDHDTGDGPVRRHHRTRRERRHLPGRR